MSQPNTTPTIVHLVGAGPGDPGLVTLRCRALLEKADCVIYDALVGSAILDMICSKAEKIFVGKRAGRHSMEQPEINNTIIEAAGRHHCVVRLKGGDPFVFGRGGEEVEALLAAGIKYEVVPGVTAGVAVPAAVGIPVTHRALSRSVTFITGHPRSEDEGEYLPWAALASEGGTLIFYMGLTSLSAICTKLMSAGLPADTPAAVVQQGCTPHQQQVYGTVADLERRVAQAALKPPALIIIGRVAALGPRFSSLLS